MTSPGGPVERIVRRHASVDEHGKYAGVIDLARNGIDEILRQDAEIARLRAFYKPQLELRKGAIWTNDGRKWVVKSATARRVTLIAADTELQAYRLSAGLTQERMAEALGISQSWLCKLESGQFVTPNELLAKAAGMTPNARLTGVP
jgi:DNA-binding XRE family transcriptional regulator